MKLGRLFVVLAVAALLSPSAEASRPRGWESNPPALAFHSERGEPFTARAFDLGDIVIAGENDGEEVFRLGAVTFVAAGADIARCRQGTSDAIPPAIQSSIGATWAWSGDGRLLGITTNGPLKTAHRFGYIGGPGAQPQLPNGASPAKWRLGTLTVGTAGTSDPLLALPLGEGGSSPWGQFQYGYRDKDNAKLGRLVASPSVGAPSSSAWILSSQGWAWGIDAGSRLSSAMAGKGSLTGISQAATSNAIERFQHTFGAADQLTRLVREIAAEDVEQASGLEGRPSSRTVSGTKLGGDFAYDGEGRRTEDDRFTNKWYWFGKLAEVRVKDAWPPRKPGGDPVVSPYAGHLIKWEYDSLGRAFSRTHLGALPQGATADCSRPFIERREFLWEGQNFLGEAGYGPAPDGACSEAIGPIRWRKSYVPGAAGLDDQVQLRVEVYGASNDVVSDKLYSYLRDEQQTVQSLVEERAGADPTKPPVPLRYLYTPFGEAHVEVGPEVRRARFDAALTSVGSQTQAVTDANHLAGGVPIDFSVPIDTATLSSGVLVERLTDGTWGALTAADLALAQGTEPEQLVVLPLAGWQRGTTYRIRLTTALKDVSGRSVSNPPPLEIPFPPLPADGQVGSASISFERVYPVEYESAFASAETANGAFPGGQNLGWQGHWVDPVTGLDMVRARVYDPRTASWLSPDPLGDVDSPNLYAFVAGKPHEKTDPLGLESIRQWFGADDDIKAGKKAKGYVKKAGYAVWNALTFEFLGRHDAAFEKYEKTGDTASYVRDTAKEVGRAAVIGTATIATGGAAGAGAKTLGAAIVRGAAGGAASSVAGTAAGDVWDRANGEKGASAGDYVSSAASGALFGGAAGAAGFGLSQLRGGRAPGPGDVLGPEGEGQFVLRGGQGTSETASIVRRGEYVNRTYDSSWTPGAPVSGPLGRSFTPGSGVPTTAADTIAERGLNIFYPNNSQTAAIYRASQNIPAVSRTAIGGTAPEVLIDSQFWPNLTLVREFPVVPNATRP